MAASLEETESGVSTLLGAESPINFAAPANRPTDYSSRKVEQARSRPASPPQLMGWRDSSELNGQNEPLPSGYEGLAHLQVKTSNFSRIAQYVAIAVAIALALVCALVVTKGLAGVVWEYFARS